MGNRAVVTWAPDENIDDCLGVYLHWNGGIDSIKAFLTYCKIREFREPDKDNYGYSHFCQVVCNYFGGGLDCGIDLCKNLDCDNGDNGVYLCKGWDIVGHMYGEPVHDGFNMLSMLIDINASQPESEQLKRETLEQCYRTIHQEEQKKSQDFQTSEQLGSFFF